MQYCDNFDFTIGDAIDDNMIWMSNEFPRVGYPPNAVQIRMAWKLRNDAFDVVDKVERGLRAALRKIVENCCKICLRFSAPQDRKHGRGALLR